MATIRDVAKEAGVAPSTVSYVLNDTKPVKEETRLKVLEAIDKLNYMPSAIARSLKTKTTSTIGLIIPDISNPFFSEITKGIEDVANESGYTVFICNTYENREKEEEYLKTLIQKEADGLIYVGAGSFRNELLEKGSLPIVIVDRKINKEMDNYGDVLVDNEGGAYDATSYFIKKGHKDITLLSGPLDISTYNERLSGYKRALIENNIKFSEKLVYQILQKHININGGYEVMEKIIKDRKVTEAIFATNDLIAIGAIKSLQENGFHIPRDVKIIGFDDIYPSSLITPALTTVAQPKYEMGARAMKMLYDLMNNSNKAKTTIILDTDIVIRGSA